MVSAGIGGKLSALCLGKTELNAAGPPGGTESNPFNFTFYFFRIVDLSKGHKGCQFWMAFMFECALMNSLPVSKSSLTQRKNSS